MPRPLACRDRRGVCRAAGRSTARGALAGFTLNTTSFRTTSEAMPTIWAPFDEPVFVRMYTTEPYLAWTVRQVSDRALGVSGVAGETLARTLRAERGVSRRAVRLDTSISTVCPGPAHYQDIVLDDADADRARIYGLDLTLDSTAAALRARLPEATQARTTAAVSDGSYYFHVRRYRPVYGEASLGPIISTGRLVSHTVERLGTGGPTPQVVLNETEQRGQVQLAAGAMLRPWGYNPNTRPDRYNWEGKRPFSRQRRSPKTFWTPSTSASATARRASAPSRACMSTAGRPRWRASPSASRLTRLPTATTWPS